jgi:hypothetical protein
MCPREFPLFPVFLRFPQYYGFRKYVDGFRNMVTVSEICLRFPKYINVSRCSSTLRVQYQSMRGTTRSLDSFLVRLRAVLGVFGGIPSPGCQLSSSYDRSGGAIAVQGVSQGGNMGPPPLENL